MIYVAVHSALSRISCRGLAPYSTSRAPSTSLSPACYFCTPSLKSAFPHVQCLVDKKLTVLQILSSWHSVIVVLCVSYSSVDSNGMSRCWERFTIPVETRVLFGKRTRSRCSIVEAVSTAARTKYMPERPGLLYQCTLHPILQFPLTEFFLNLKDRTLQ